MSGHLLVWKTWFCVLVKFLMMSQLFQLPHSLLTTLLSDCRLFSVPSCLRNKGHSLWPLHPSAAVSLHGSDRGQHLSLGQGGDGSKGGRRGLEKSCRRFWPSPGQPDVSGTATSWSGHAQPSFAQYKIFLYLHHLIILSSYSGGGDSVPCCQTCALDQILYCLTEAKSINPSPHSNLAFFMLISFGS